MSLGLRAGLMQSGGIELFTERGEQVRTGNGCESGD